MTTGGPTRFELQHYPARRWRPWAVQRIDGLYIRHTKFFRQQAKAEKYGRIMYNLHQDRESRRRDRAHFEVKKEF